MVVDLVKAQARATPRAPAVRCAGIQLTYAELDARANRLARRLRARGVGPGDLVAVWLDRSVELVSGVLGVLYAGAGYVPLEATDPPDRRDSIVRDCAATALVTTSPAVARAGIAVVELDDRSPDLEVPSADPVPPGPRDIAYVIYTSGSTGRPKGVVVEHAALAAYLRFAAANYAGLDGVVPLHSSISFDMSITSLLGPLTVGGCVLVVDPTAPPSPADPPAPTLLKVTPSHLTLAPALLERYAPTRTLVVGGEQLLRGPLDDWRRSHPGVTVVNEYGPTEATVGCCVHTIRPHEEITTTAVPIGLPVDGVTLHLLDADDREVADGTVGQLCIAGTQLARGYLGRDELTEAAFPPNPFGEPGSRMYRTGDLARRRADGRFEYVGRADEQIKLHGYRIEPGEVRAAIQASAAVSDAAVVVDHAASPAELVAYLAVAPDRPIEVSELRTRLAATLPAYMVPAHFVVLPALPLAASGKLDRAALPSPQRGPAPPVAAAEAAGPTVESVLCDLFADVTGASQAGPDDDFFAMGGTSLAAARLVTRARREGIELRLVDLLRERTVRRLLAGRHGRT